MEEQKPNNISKVVDRLRRERHAKDAAAREAGEQCGRHWAEDVAEEEELRDVAEFEVQNVRREHLDVLMRRNASLYEFICSCAEDEEWCSLTQGPYEVTFTAGLVEAARDVWRQVQKHL